MSLLAGGLLALLVGFILWWDPLHWVLRGTPCLLPLPFFGSMFLCPYRSFLQAFDTVYRTAVKKGGAIGCHFFTRPCLVLSDPEIFTELLTSDHEHFTSRGIHVDPVGDPLTLNIFFAEGEQWRQIRSKMSPIFTPAKLKASLADCGDVLRELDKILDQGGTQDVKETMLRVTIGLISTGSFGLRSDTLTNPDSFFYRLQLDLLYSFSARVVSFMFCPRIAHFFGFKIAAKEVQESYMSLVKDVVSEREKGRGARDDALKVLVALKKAETRPEGDIKRFADGTVAPNYSMVGVGAAMLTIYTGGTETSGSAIAFLLFELAVNPEVQDRVRQEVDQLCLKSPDSVSITELSSLPYLNMVILESLRKYPAVFMVMRECTKDYKLKNGIQVKRGDLVLVPMSSLQMDERYFPEPQEFIPERFSPEAKAKRTQGVYLPFGLGPRTCIGMRHALLMIATVTASVVRRYKLRLPRGSSPILRLDPYKLISTTPGPIDLIVDPITPRPAPMQFSP